MEKPADSTILNVCVLPSEDIARQCTDISQSLDPEAVMFSLGKDKFPHMTVYMARFSNDRIEDVVSLLDQALGSAKPFGCRHTGYFMTAGRYLEASYEKTEEFMRFHKSIMNQLSGLRINPGRPYEESYFAPYTPEQRKNAETTGYDLANDLYRPHITLTRYQEGRVPPDLPALPDTDLSFSLDKVGIYKADDNGAVYEELKTYKFV